MLKSESNIRLFIKIYIYTLQKAILFYKIVLLSLGPLKTQMLNVCLCVRTQRKTSSRSSCTSLCRLSPIWIIAFTIISMLRLSQRRLKTNRYKKVVRFRLQNRIKDIFIQLMLWL